MATVTSIVVLTSAVIIATQLHEVQSKRYEFSTNCQCNWKRVSGCNKTEEYPDYDDMGFSGDCIPTVLPNERLCYRLKVKRCERSYKCRFFDGVPGFKNKSLPVAGINGSVESVIIQSLPKTEFRTVCFYNISLPNCSAIRLKHTSNHSEEKYVDGLEGPNTNTTNRECKSYVNVYYAIEGSQQHEEFCGERLAKLNREFHSSSLLLVYWTNDDRSNNGSFHLHAQCD